jgi:hypothetical protein
MPDKPVSRWENTERDGTRWWVEIESDMWDYEKEGLVVSIWTENEDPEDDDTRPVQTLVMASPQQAREMAAALVRCADHVEKWHAENPPPRVHTP